MTSTNIVEKNIRLLKWFNFFSDSRPYNPVAIIYFAQVTGSFAVGLAVFSVHSIAACVFEIPTGVWSDMVGRKKTIIAGACASALCLTFYAIGGSFAVLACGAVMAGLAEALFSGNNRALLYDTLAQHNQESRYGEISGKVGSMFQLALGVSALIGGFIANVSFGYVMWLSVVPQLVSVVLACFIVEPKKHAGDISTNVFDHLKEALQKFKDNYQLRNLSLARIFDFGIGETLHQFTPAFIVSVWPTWALGIARGLNNVFGFVGFWYAGRFMKKVSVYTSLIVGSISDRVLALVAFGLPTVLSPVLLSFGSVFFGFARTAQDTLLQKEFTQKQRATMDSLNSFAGNIVFAVFAYGFGMFADMVGPTKALLVGEVLMLSVLWFYMNVHRFHSTNNQ